jgi:hypothetical protein
MLVAPEVFKFELVSAQGAWITLIPQHKVYCTKMIP